MEDREIILSILFLVGFILLLRFALYRWMRYDEMQVKRNKGKAMNL